MQIIGKTGAGNTPSTCKYIMVKLRENISSPSLIAAYANLRTKNLQDLITQKENDINLNLFQQVVRINYKFFYDKI